MVIDRKSLEMIVNLTLVQISTRILLMMGFPAINKQIFSPDACLRCLDLKEVKEREYFLQITITAPIRVWTHVSLSSMGIFLSLLCVSLAFSYVVSCKLVFCFLSPLCCSAFYIYLSSSCLIKESLT